MCLTEYDEAETINMFKEEAGRRASKKAKPKDDVLKPKTKGLKKSSNY